MSPAGLRDVSALDTFLNDLPLLFRGSIYAWSPAQGLYKLTCGIPLSRYVGVIEITTPAGPLFDLILDATETNANPAALVWVRRRMMPAESEEGLRAYAASIGAEFIK